MKQYLSIFILAFGVSCTKERSAFKDNITLVISPYQDKSQNKASAMPVVNPKSDLMTYQMRFDYLLMNVPEIHRFEKIRTRDTINSLYPDTAEIRKRYMDIYCGDKKLMECFDDTYNAIKNPDLQRDKVYSADELMEVASKFFYCDEVRPDSSVQMHVCIGLNGVKETKWEKDYTLLAAFCYEAIFNDMGKEGSKIRSAFSSEHEAAVKQFRNNITTLDKYLEDTRTSLFARMKTNVLLKEKLLAYYELNKKNVAFKIVK